MVLPRLTVLDGRYAIGRALDATEPLIYAYQAWNLHTEDQVVLEEFFPAPLVHRVDGTPDVEAVETAHEEIFRYGRSQFLKETAVLATIKHPNLVEVHEHIEAHNTAYRVLKHYKGATLASVLAKQDGRLPPKTAFTILMPLLDALQAAHQRGLIHGAVSPQAILLTKERGPMLRGFRTTHVMMAQRTGDWKHLIMEGTSAPEQYEAGGRQGPWTDLYGSAATLFTMLTGQSLPAAPQRLGQDEVPALLQKVSTLSAALRLLIEQALSLDSAQRPRSVQSFQKQLIKALTKSPSSPKPSAIQVAKAPPKPDPNPKPEAKPLDKSIAVKKTVPVKSVVEEDPIVVVSEDVASERAQSARQPHVASETREDQAAEEVATQAAKKQAAQKLVVQQLAAQQQDVDEDAPPPKHRTKRSPKRQKADREAVRSRRGLPVLAALAVVVLVAFAGAFVLMQDENSSVAQFAHYKAQGDSLFAVANYMDAKNQYEFALVAVPNNEYITGRLTETQQRLVEVQDARYIENLVQGDALYAQADSLLKDGDALGALSFFAEANKAYYEALRYRPDDPIVLEKGKLTNAGVEEALRQNEEPGEQEEGAASDPQDLRRQLYNSYRTQGDQLFARADYAGAREKYSRALKERPGDPDITAKIEEVDAYLEASGLNAQFEAFLQQGLDFNDAERYAEAHAAFQQALGIKPDDQHALDGLERAASMLEDVRREALYQPFRDQGDSLFRANKYAEALARYEEALTAKPGDAYAQQRIQEIQQILQTQRQVQEAPGQTPVPDEPESGIFTVVDEAPELIGGLKELHGKVEYPDRARRLGTEGRVYVQFVVTEDGGVQDATVIRGIGDGCDEEAIRVVKGARFVPGKVQGQPVKVRHTLFVTFKLN